MQRARTSGIAAYQPRLLEARIEVGGGEGTSSVIEANCGSLASGRDSGAPLVGTIRVELEMEAMPR